MDLETAVGLVFEGQLGIIVDNKEEARTLVWIAESLGFPRSSETYNGIPDTWNVFGYIGSADKKRASFYFIGSRFARTRDLVSFSDLSTVAFDTSSICDLL